MVKRVQREEDENAPWKFVTKAPRRLLTLLAAIFSIFAIVLVLLARFSGSVDILAIPSGKDNSGQHDHFRLHPEDHIFRTSTTIRQQWNITSDIRRPDGVSKRVYVINGDWPAPTIEARSGDTLEIEVINALDSGEGLSIHWHGLMMRGYNDMDGAVGVTQKAVGVGESFTYGFQIGEQQHGTLWYHAHSAVQRADGLYGGLVVHQPAVDRQGIVDVDAEHLLMIGDWYHRSAEEALDFYDHIGSFGLEPVPDSVVVNGKGHFNCKDAVPARPLDCQDLSLEHQSPLRLDSNKRNIIRTVNVGAYAGFHVRIEGTQLTPLNVDGGNAVTGSPAASLGILYPGERVDMLVEPDSQSKHLEMIVTLDDTSFKFPNPTLTLVHRFPVSWTARPRLSSKSTLPATQMADLQSLSSQHDQSVELPNQADQTVVLYTMTQKLTRLDNVPKGFINHTTWRPQSEPLKSLARDHYDKHQLVPSITFDADSPRWVDIVLNNLDEEGHPFHLHGYDFWVLSTYSSTYNWGSYNPFEGSDPPGGGYNLQNPVKKDTVLVPRRGYAVLRFKADNPGIWMFHCHVLWHLATGMAMALEVGG